MKRLNRKRLLALLTASLLLTLLAACSQTDQNAESARTADAQQETSEEALFPIRIVTQTGFNELNVGEALGFFADEGIKLEYIGALPKGVTEYQLIEQGELDAFTTGHPPNVAQARIAGIDVRAVSPGMIDDEEFPHVRYLVRPDSDIQSLENAPGHKIAVSSISGCTTGYVQYYLKQQGLDPDSVEFVVIPDTEALQSLSQGLLDITTSHPPFAGIAVANGTAREIMNTWDIFASPGVGLSVRGFSEEFIAEHPDIVQGFVNAMYRSHLWIHDNLDEAKDIVASYLDLEPVDLSSFYYDTHKNITPEYIEQWFEICEDIGLWNDGDVEPEDTYDNSFVPIDAPESDKTLHWENAS
jgi:ABC-type nitrate/sulfonate/bicarbonate transport system substrate-binding protein